MLRSIILVLLAVVLTLGACAVSIAAVTTTWPQPLKLNAGQSAKWTFEVDTPGQITVDVTWQGGGLYVLLTDPSGKAVNTPPSIKASPVKVLYTATAADILKGKQWTVTVGAPPSPVPSQSAVAQGNISVKVPVAARISIQQKPSLVHEPLDIVLPASIQSITPATGSPMDTVIIAGKNLPEEKNHADVWFDIGASTLTQGTILNISKSAGVVNYQVRVPGNDYVYNPHAGQLYVKLRDNGQVTNSLTFNYVPCAPPTITAHSPQYGKPGVSTTFTGIHFRQTDKVHFVDPVKGDVTAQTTYRSPSEIVALMPSDYTTNALKTITVYVRFDCKGHPQNGPKYNYPLDPSAANAKPK